MSQAKFIVFDGVDGSGKSTQIKLLCEYLKKQQIPYTSTREPGGSDIAEKIRNLLLNPQNKISLYSELLMIYAARANHFEKTILPTLISNKWVICDRYLDSSFAYQGARLKHSKNLIKKINNTYLDNIKLICKQNNLKRKNLGEVDFTFFLDLPPQISEQRILNRYKKQKNKKDRFELENINYFKKVRQIFKQRAEIKQKLNQGLIIDAQKNLETIHNIIKTKIAEI